jgi:multimeric flavodoxin WrbA
MKVLGLLGSPRKEGNTATLIQEAFRAAQDAGAETEMIDVNGLDMKGCQACYACRKTKQCRLKDDMSAVYGKIDAADAVIFGSPIYMCSMTAQMKAVVDRLFPYLNPDYTSNMKTGKRCGLIFCQYQPDPNLFLNHIKTAAFMLNVLGFEKPKILIGHGLLEPDNAGKNQALMDRAFALGKDLTAAKPE